MTSMEAPIDVLMNTFFARLSHYCEIGDAERDALRALTTRERVFDPGEDVIERGDTPKDALIVKSGWAARYIALKDGRSQILNFLLPGDFFDLQVYIADAADHSITAITRVTALAIPGHELLDVFSKPNKLGLALWWAALQEEAILREQIVRNGRRDAGERVAHLLLELHRRTMMIGEGSEHEFRLPVSQVLIADALGLSFVHISRVLKKFVTDGLIEKDKDTVIIKDREALVAKCDFSSDYLHLEAGPPRYRLRSSFIRPAE